MKITIKAIAVLSLLISFANGVFAGETVRKTFHPAPSGHYDSLGITKSLEVGLSPNEAPAIKAGRGTLTIEALSTYWGDFNVENEMYVGSNGRTLKVVKGSNYNGTTVNEYRVGIGLNANERPMEALDIRVNAGIRELIVAPADWTSGHPYLRLGTYEEANDGVTSVLEAKDNDYAPIYLHGNHIFLNSRDDSYYVPSTGNVGIGVSNPSYKLDVNGTIMAHNYDVLSSRSMKTDIQPISAVDYKQILNQAIDIRMARYHYKNEKPDQMPHLGVIAEETPTVLLSNDKKALSLSDELGFLIAVIKQLIVENKEIEKKIQILEERYMPYGPEAKHVA